MAAPPRNTTYELIYHIAQGNVPRGEIPQVLTTIFHAPDYKHSLQQIPEQDIRVLVDRLDHMIDSRTLPEDIEKRTQRCLRKICGLRKVLPRSHIFQGRLHATDKRPVGSGGTADIWKVEDSQRHVYAAKVFRVYGNGDDSKIRRFYKETTLWKRLNHPNVLQTYGAAPDFGELCVVSPWMTGGELGKYLERYPGANRVSIMIGIVDGLSYLHFNDVVHGDLKGGNIMFDNEGTPRISDFGHSSITFAPTQNASSPNRGCSLRWSPPEIMEARNDSEAKRPTKMSDVYSFAMVVVEVFTGDLPFPNLSDYEVQLEIGRGKRPHKPADASRLGLSSKAWKVVEDCWNKRQDKRPPVWSVAERLRACYK